MAIFIASNSFVLLPRVIHAYGTPRQILASNSFVLLPREDEPDHRRTG